MIDFKRICNIGFVFGVKVTKKDKLLIVDIKRQQGKKYNYIVVCCDPLFNGVYRYDANKKFRIWDNNGKPCYVVPLRDTEKIKDIEDLDPKQPIGKYILNIVRKIRNEREA